MSFGGQRGWDGVRRRPSQHVFWSLGFAAAALGETAAHAAEVTWAGPAACDDRTYVVEQAEALSGRSLATIEGLSFDVRVVQAATEWELVLITRAGAMGEPRERKLRGKSCSEVSEAAAVAIAMTLGGQNEPNDANETSAEIAEAPETAAPAAPPERPATRAKPPVSQRATEPGLEGLVALHALLDVGTLPSAALGFDVGAGVAWRKLRVVAEGGYVLPSEVQIAEGRGGTFELLYGALLVCAVQPLGPVVGSSCAGYEVGRMSGEGEGVSDPHLENTFWHAGRLELGLGISLAQNLRLSAGGGVAVPFSRPEFVLDPGEVVHRPSSVIGRFRAGIELGL
jgi:hypothetical protein